MTKQTDPGGDGPVRRVLAAGRTAGYAILGVVFLLGMGMVANPSALRLSAPQVPAALAALLDPPPPSGGQPDGVPPVLPLMQMPFLGSTVQMADLSPLQQKKQLTALKDAGFGWVRQRVDWGRVAPSPGQFDWSTVDDFVDGAVAAGLIPVLVLDGSPAWARAARDQDAPFAPPANFADFARFAQALAARYGDRVRYYQVWDEPNIAPHWGNRLIDPVGYARLLAAAAPALRGQDSDAQILLAALAPTTDRGHTAIDEISYLERLYAAGAAANFDILAVQPFGFGRTPQEAPRPDHLNFRRVELVRRAMLAAGDGDTPIWAVRFGWNVRLFAPWGTVTPANQVDFAQEAISLAWSNWPWLATMGWAIDRPAADATDPLWGFALSTPVGDDLPILGALSATAARLAEGPRPVAFSLGWERVWALLVLGVLAAGAGWRGWRAGGLLPWRRWHDVYANQPPWRIVLAWAGLLIVLYLATWPPLILVCWVLAGLGFTVHPRLSLYLAVFLLPFHFFHKELTLPWATMTVPPAYAALGLGLPGQARLALVRWRAGWRLDWTAMDGLALGWLILGLVGMAGGWPWPAYGHGMVETVLFPLILYAAVRALTTSGPLSTARSVENHRLVAAAALGGILGAAVGLWAWMAGDSTVVDGVRRLTAPTFSPNHTALYLERSLFLVIGLAMAAGSRRSRWAWLAGGGILLMALALTASRGAWLLGLPTGGVIFVLLWRSTSQGVGRLNRRGWRWIGVAGLGGLSALILVWGDRFTNSATVLGRFQLWRSSLDLWLDHVWIGVGPGRFTWRYPAYVTAQTANEPNLLHPHNLWLEFATTDGILGLVWLAALLVVGWLWMRRLGQGLRAGTKASGSLLVLGVGVLAGLAAGFGHGQVDAFTALADVAAWNWLAFGLMAGLVDKR